MGKPAGTRKKAKAATTGFSAEERAAMKARAAELKAGSARADGEKLAREAIEALPAADRTLARWVHEAIAEVAPELVPRTWYGMPAYALDGQVICFFQGASKFKARYSTFGFSDKARLDDGAMWPVAFALTELGAADREATKALILKAIGR